MERRPVDNSLTSPFDAENFQPLEETGCPSSKNKMIDFLIRLMTQ